MLNCKKLIQKPALFTRIIGIKHEIYLLLVSKIRKLWNITELERKGKQIRVRAIGGGRKYKLENIEEKVLLILMFYRYNMTHAFLGLIFDLDASNITRLINKLMPLFEEAADPNLKNWLEIVKKQSEKITNPVAFFKKFPEFKKITVDATEQRTFRPQNKEKRKRFYSGKRKMFSTKTQICIDKKHRILDVSKSFPGTVHDKKMFDIEKTMGKIPIQSIMLADLGYLGIKKDYQEANIILPFKRKKGEGELSIMKKQFNKEQAHDRVIVEHVLCKIKKFKICSDIYRGKEKNYNQIFRNVSALVNLNYCSI